MNSLLVVCMFLFAFLGVVTPTTITTTMTSTITTTMSTTMSSTITTTMTSTITTDIVDYAIKNITKNFCHICKCKKNSQYCNIGKLETLPFESTRCDTGFILTPEITSVNCLVVDNKSNVITEVITGVVITFCIIGFLIWVFFKD